ncbi:hypothetical protein DIZ27_19835 [Streptomyces sp. NWU339]|uniref:hypothetical protein n=1 Tax=Streptomyces sp. NWU339 TaxID=2185284 RepID=UPI000D67B91A|nr:hypothetical protein [Streptomyces sp. NWU339]PWI08944.1 hypothetical protein DIZ27_19835 [Streptomyces sp. NWU339]
MSRGIFFVQRVTARPVAGGLTALLLGLVPAGAASAVAGDIGWNGVQASDIGWNGVQASDIGWNVGEGPGQDIGWNGSGA